MKNISLKLLVVMNKFKFLIYFEIKLAYLGLMNMLIMLVFIQAIVSHISLDCDANNHIFVQWYEYCNELNQTIRFTFVRDEETPFETYFAKALIFKNKLKESEGRIIDLN
jgi:hypothetical protein